MKALLFVTTILISNFATAEEFHDVDSPEEAAKLLLDRKCGGDGQLLDIEKVDEDYDYAAYFVELSNGSATVYSFKTESDLDPYVPYDNLYYSIEDYTCLPVNP